jgi:hypothetical protein
VKQATILMLGLLLASTGSAIGQQSPYEWFISPNVNLYIPLNNPAKGVYPVLWYDSKTKPKLLLGGFGIGGTIRKNSGKKVNLRGQANLSKHTYWDEPVLLSDENGMAIGPFLAGSSDYMLGTMVSAHYSLSEKISIGSGLSGQLLLVSISRLPLISYQSQTIDATIAANRHYKRLVPMLPVELSFASAKRLITLRYEHGLINRVRGDLRQRMPDNFGLLTLEAGFRLK